MSKFWQLLWTPENNLLQLVVRPRRKSHHQITEIAQSGESHLDGFISGIVEFGKCLTKYPDRILQQCIAGLKLLDELLVEVDNVPGVAVGVDGAWNCR